MSLGYFWVALGVLGVPGIFWGHFGGSQGYFGGVLGGFTCRLPPWVQHHNGLRAEELLGHHLGGRGAPLEPHGHQGPPGGVRPEGPVLEEGTRWESEGTPGG